MKAVEPGAMAVRPMSEGRTARLPAHVLVLPAPQQIGWLDSSEACTLFKRKTRQRFRRTIVAQLAELSRQALASRTTQAVAVVEEGEVPDEEWVQAYATARRNSKLGTARGITPCRCQYCDDQLAVWPPYYVSRWLTGLAAIVNRRRRRPRLSWECFLERNPPRREVYVLPAMTDAEAEKAGLTVKKSCRNSRGTRPPKVGGCHKCGGKRPKGNKFCGKCEAAERKDMNASGYFGPAKM